MELSIRLQAVADMVTKGRRVADIGCDHGYVSIYLCRQKQCPKVIAMDVKEGPLKHAKANIDRYGLADYIETRLSDGTDGLRPKEVDTLLLSGMGGRLVIRILERGFLRLGKFSELVLQPQSEIFLVRAFLRQQGYRIVDENMVIDEGKFYSVIKAVPVGEGSIEKETDGHNYSRMVQDYFGPVLLTKRPQAFGQFLQREADKTQSILKQVTKRERIEELENYLSYIKEAMGPGQNR